MTFGSGQAARDAALIRRIGESVSYVLDGDSPRSIPGLFQKAARPSDIGDVSMQSRSPFVTVLRSDVPELSNRDRFRINDADYGIAEIIDDEGECIFIRLTEIR